MDEIVLVNKINRRKYVTFYLQFIYFRPFVFVYVRREFEQSYNANDIAAVNDT